MGEEIFAIRVAGSTELSSDEPLENVVVRVSIINDMTGELIRKSQKSNKTFSQYESSRVIPPCQTRGIDCNTMNSLSAMWNEVFLFNEPISTILHPDIVILFELIDCTIHKGGDYFHPVAWGFLRTVYRNKELSIVNKKSVLQLYEYPPGFQTRLKGYRVPAFELLQKKDAIDSRLTVEIISRLKNSTEIEEVECRPSNVFQKEIGAKTLDELLDDDSDLDDNNNALSNNEEHVDEDDRLKTDTGSKLYSRKCAVPKILCSQIPAGENGALCLRFNHDGSLLAAAIQIDNQFNVQLYSRPNNNSNVPMQLSTSFVAHIDLIHEISFSSNDKYLLSVSADGMAKIWMANGSSPKPKYIFPHSGFVYTGKFHPLDDTIIATAGFDGSIRIWDRKKEKCILTLNQHKARINSLVFSPNGKQMFCGDANGCISVWDVDIIGTEAKKAEDRIVLQKFVIEGEIRGCCITHLEMGKSNLSLLVHTQDSIVRNFETKVMVPSQRYVGAICTKYRMESAFSPDGAYVFAGSENGSVMLWSVKGSDPVPIIQWSLKFSYPVTTIAWNPSDDMVAFSSFGSGQPILIFVDKPIMVKRRKRPVLPKQPVAHFLNNVPPSLIDADDDEDQY